MANFSLPIPAHDERGLVVGRTGSGKSQLTKFMLWHMPGSIIYDTKGEGAFDEMGPVVKTVDDAFRVFAEEGDAVDHVVVRPPGHLLAYPMVLDDMLMEHYERGEGITAYIDEALQFHRNGRAGPGYVNLLTRGRSKGITTLTSTQRPAFLSLFALTEVDHIYVMRLQHHDDMQRVANILPDYDKRERVPFYHIDYANAREETITRLPPIDIDYRPERVYRENTAGRARSEYFNWI